MILGRVNKHGSGPFSACALHGGPGGAGEVNDLARALHDQTGCSILEPWQSQDSVAGQVTELAAQIQTHTDRPIAILGWSWGAWLGCLLTRDHPDLVSHLVLIGSAPFDAESHKSIKPTRMAKFSPAQLDELKQIVPHLSDPQVARRFSELYEISDAYDPIDTPLPEVQIDMDINSAVWGEAKPLRDRGDWPTILREITCPITAIHGVDDPHPAAGVFETLKVAQPGTNTILLNKCGHKPWRERHASDQFYDHLKAILAL